MNNIQEIQQIRDVIMQNEQQSIECWQTSVLALCDSIEKKLNGDHQIKKLSLIIQEMKSRLEFYAPIKGVKLIDPVDATIGYADLGSLAREYLSTVFDYKG